MNNKAIQVAVWEFVEKVKTKAFIISLVFMPLIMVAFGILPTFLSVSEDNKPVTIGIVDESGTLVKPLAGELDQKYKLSNGQPNYIIRNLAGEDGTLPTKEAANKMVVQGKMEGYFFVPTSVYDSGEVEYRSENAGNIKLQERFSRAIEDVVMEKRFAEHNIDPSLMKKLIANVDVKSIKLSQKGEEKAAGFLETFFSAYVVIMMMFFLILTNGQLLVRSVLEEKSNRVIEVLLSSCSARDLMTGKILGLGFLGLFQLLIWGTMGFVVMVQFKGVTIIAPENLLASFAYLIFGFLLYAGIFVAVGSPVTTEQEAQQLTGYIVIFLIAPIILILPIMQNPDSLLVKVLSYVPLLTPTLMVLRMAVQMPPLWEILATLGVLIASSLFMMWAAGKIFGTAILSYGKRPSLAELIRWVRAA